MRRYSDAALKDTFRVIVSLFLYPKWVIVTEKRTLSEIMKRFSAADADPSRPDVVYGIVSGCRLDSDGSTV